ncbi:MAG: hypothetical protein AB7H77_07565 [Bdellovibrionales bacterium]
MTDPDPSAAAVVVVPVQEVLPPFIPESPGPENIPQVLHEMFEVLVTSESDPARVSAGKALLDRLEPKKDQEQLQREAEERESALLDIKRILAEYSAYRLDGLREPAALAGAGAAEPDHPAAADGAAGRAE